IDEVIESINAVFEDELKVCKKVELKLISNVGADKYLLDNIWNEIYKQLNSKAMINSTCERLYKEKNIADGMCEYRIKVFDKDSSC
ncbi:MAG: hypothetical protein U9Q33_04745, partial [Campylobacterota bacterium]|nr:hypothetical protein [Campylobacterota bacterium]